MKSTRPYLPCWRLWTLRALLLGALLFQVVVGAAAPIQLRAPWNPGEWWQPSTLAPSHCGLGLDKAVDFNRVSAESVLRLNGTWPYADEVGPEVEVRAAHDGTVVYGAGSMPQYGKFLSLVSSLYPASPRHLSLYAHLQRYAVPNRTVVKAGDVIAYCGGTGSCPGCDTSLHFEYRIDNVRQDTGNLVFDGQPVVINYQRVTSESSGARYLGLPIEARSTPSNAVPAFPGAGGFGAASMGGRGGRVIQVTNLNAYGAGSLREALLATGPRTVVFRVSGTIDLQRQTIKVSSPYLTVAGQTAPGGGITLKRGNLNLLTHDLVFRHLRVRSGPGGYGGDDGSEGDCIKIDGRLAYNIVLDHLSLSWSTDEALSEVGESYNITIQHCLIAEPMNLVPAPYTHPKGAHSKALFQAYRASRVTYNKNLIAHSVDRVPTITSGDAQFC